MLAKGMSFGLFVAGSGGLGRRRRRLGPGEQSSDAARLVRAALPQPPLQSHFAGRRRQPVHEHDDPGVAPFSVVGDGRGADGHLPVVPVGRVAFEFRVRQQDHLHCEHDLEA